MKKTFKQVLCLFMVFQILIMGTGFTVIHHFCKIKGQKTFIFSKPNCCPENKLNDDSYSKAHLKRPKCCKEHSSFYKINTESNVSFNIEFSGFFAIFFDNIVACDFSKWWHLVTVKLFSPHVLSNPPPLYGRSLLIHIQTFLI